MNTDNQFDGLLRQKFENEKREFDQSEWLKAEKLISAKEKRDRNKKILWYSFALLFLASAFLMWNFPGTNNNQENQKAEKQKSKIQNDETGSKIKEKNSMSFVGVNEFPDAEREMNQSVRKDQIHSGQDHINSMNTTQKHKTESGRGSLSASQKFVISSESNISTDEIILAEKVVEIQNGIGEDIKNSIGDNVSIKSEEPEINDLNVSHTSEMSSSSDSITKSNIDIAADFVNEKKRVYPSKSVCVFAGGFISRSLAGTNGGSGFGINVLAGVELMQRFNEKWSLAFDLVYIEKGMINTFRNFHSEFYSGEFGRRVEDESISAKKLRYASVPVIIAYHLKSNRQIIEGGVSYNYLLNVLSEIHTMEYSTGSPAKNSTTKSDGYVNGFEKYDIGLHVGYSQSIFDVADLGIRLHYGLRDITKDAYFRDRGKDNISGIQFFLKYKIF